jgi:DNA polymerase-3 subunit gamma/tau
MTYPVLARKWRPQEFDAVVGQEPVTRTVRNALVSGRVAHAYLFTGPRGVGKTTTARLLAKALCCTARQGAEACGACPSCRDFVAGAPVDVMEIDAASNTGIDDIRTLRDNVKYSPARGRFKVYIIDEVHMLSGAAFNAFLKTLEEPPGHVVFILATTDPKKIPATVLSRCQRFDFRPIGADALTATLTAILDKEQVPFEPAALPMLVRASEGSLRDALSLLDTAIAYGEGRLDEASVAQLLGASSPVHVRAFVQSLLVRDGAAALEAIDRAATAGEDLAALCREVVETARQLLILKTAPSASVPDLSAAEAESLRAAAPGVSTDELIYLLRAFLDADAEMRRSPHPRVELEIAAVRTTRRPAPQTLDALLAKVEDALATFSAGGIGAGGGSGGVARSAPAQDELLPAPGAPGTPAPPAPATPPARATRVPARQADPDAGAPSSQGWRRGEREGQQHGASTRRPSDERAGGDTEFPARPAERSDPGERLSDRSEPAPSGRVSDVPLPGERRPDRAQPSAATRFSDRPEPSAAARLSDRPETGPASRATERSGPAPAPVSDVVEGWERVVGEVLRRKPVLAAVLQSAVPIAVEGDALMLSLAGNHFHKDMLNDRANREIMNQAIQQSIAGARRFELDANGEGGTTGARNHPDVQAVLNEFQGEVVAVRPRAQEEGEPS